MNRNDEIDHYDGVARRAARLRERGGMDPIVAKLDALDRRKAAEALARKAQTIASLKTMTGAEIAAILPTGRRARAMTSGPVSLVR